MTPADREQIEKDAREAKVIPAGSKVAWSPTVSMNNGNRISIIHICSDNMYERTLHLNAYSFDCASVSHKLFLGQCSRCRVVVIKEGIT